MFCEFLQCSLPTAKGMGTSENVHLLSTWLLSNIQGNPKCGAFLEVLAVIIRHGITS